MSCQYSQFNYNMKKTLSLFCALLWAMTAFAQTGLEIVEKMNQMMSDRKADGLCVSVDVKIPIVGTVVTRTYTLGKKTRLEVETSKINTITFMEDTTQWTYFPENNEVLITNLSLGNANASDNPGMDVGMFDDIPEGYDISIKSQDAVKWELLCKRKKSIKDDDLPKTITLEVRKGSFEPISMSTKMMGINMSMHHFIFGVSERKVTFNPDDFPGVKIEDRRQNES